MVDLASSPTGTPDAPIPELIRTLMTDHTRFLADLDRLESLLADFRNGVGTAESGRALVRIRDQLARLADADRHHHDEEEVLFPWMRAHGIDCPPAKLKGDHEELRRRFGLARSASERDVGLDTEELVDSARAYALMLRSHIDLENEVVFPMVLQRIAGPTRARH